VTVATVSGCRGSAARSISSPATAAPCGRARARSAQCRAQVSALHRVRRGRWWPGGGRCQASTCSHAYLPLSDSSCTPGAYNPDVTQSTIHSTICVSGWTATVRPPRSYTNALKAQGVIDYGYSDTNLADYEEDHLVPLELGGAPRDPGNLGPSPTEVRRPRTPRTGWRPT
jgi:hypothetical protein